MKWNGVNTAQLDWDKISLFYILFQNHILIFLTEQQDIYHYSKLTNEVFVYFGVCCDSISSPPPEEDNMLW